MREFIQFLLASSRKTLVMLFALGVLSGAAGAALIALFSRLFAAGLELTREVLLWFALELAVAIVVVLALELLGRWLSVRLSATRTREMRLSLAETVLSDPLRKTEQTGMARLMSIYSEDIPQISNALSGVSSVGLSAFVMLGCLLYLAWLSPGIFTVLIIFSIPAIWVSRHLHQQSVDQSRYGMLQRDSHVRGFKSIIDGIKELQLNTRRQDNFFRNEYEPAVDRHSDSFIKSTLLFSLGNAWTRFIYFALIVLVLVYLAISGQAPDSLAPFLVVALFMRTYMGNILSAIPVWTRAGVILNRLDEQGYYSIRSRTARPAQSPGPLLDANTKPTIEVVDLGYQYRAEEDDRPFSVGPLNLKFQAPELVFIVGHNGAGKSTFVKLLSGLYPSETGFIRCNGIEINADNVNAYRQLFSVIFTVPHVFEQLPDSAGENELPVEEQARIVKYLERLQLSYKVKVALNRLDSTDLSHGQIKRLALLAAYMEDRPVLIFDEWAENQDPAFKEVFYHELLPELRSRGKLVFVVSHESQYFSVADRVITLNAPDTQSAVKSDVMHTAVDARNRGTA